MKVLNVSEYSTVLFAYSRVIVKIIIHTVKLKVHDILLYWSSEYFCRKWVKNCVKTTKQQTKLKLIVP